MDNHTELARRSAQREQTKEINGTPLNAEQVAIYNWLVRLGGQSVIYIEMMNGAVVEFRNDGDWTGEKTYIEVRVPETNERIGGLIGNRLMKALSNAKLASVEWDSYSPRPY